MYSTNKINVGNKDISFAFLGNMQIFPNRGFIPPCPTQIISTQNSTGIQTLLPSSGFGWYKDYGIDFGFKTGTAPDGKNYMMYNFAVARRFVLVGTPVPFRWQIPGESIGSGEVELDGVIYPASGTFNSFVTLSYPFNCPAPTP